MTGVDELFGSHRVRVILRGLPSPSEAVLAATHAWDAGVELVEVPIGEPGQVPHLVAVVAAGRERGKHVGAGTVITAEQVRTAADAGARYTVAPGFDSTVLHASVNAGLPHLPGVATPTEVQHVRAAGCRWVKVFPAGLLSPRWFSAVREPFPDMRYLATGGVTLDNVYDFLAAGADIVGFGAAVTSPNLLGGLSEVVDRCRVKSPTGLPA
jgi:2-dehydro-3-deoxyphosphogluconate aldolase/(4S)-4-hydroxy-2-oxoglutarate aldolase